MTITTHRSALAAVGALFALAACSDGPATPNAEDAQVNLDVAEYVADMTVSDIGIMTTEADLAMGSAFRSPPDCKRGPLGAFRCARRTFDQTLSISRSVTFYDSQDAVQGAYDPLETAKINFVAQIEGERSGTFFSATVNRERDFWVSGLAGQETQRTWNGTGSSAVNRTRTSDQRGGRVYDMTSSTTVSDVVIVVPRSDNWPASGTITRQVSVKVVSGLSDTRTRERTVVIEFNGTQFVPITVNGETFTLDLATRKIVRSNG